MTKFKTLEEMNILIEKINKREIYWDNMEDELEKMRREKNQVVV
jgi:hypothetical protein